MLLLDADSDHPPKPDVYKYDPNFKENEEAYAQIKYEILGSDDEDGSGDEGDTEESASDDESEVDDGIKADGTVDVHDQTGANVVNLRRTIYLTIMSALDFEEATHKLLKLDIAPGQEVRPPPFFASGRSDWPDSTRTTPAGRAVQHGHRVLLARAHLQQVLRPHGRALLQDQPDVGERVRAVLHQLLRDDPPLRDEPAAQHCALLRSPHDDRRHLVDGARHGQDERGRHDVVVAYLHQDHVPGDG